MLLATAAVGCVGSSESGPTTRISPPASSDTARDPTSTSTEASAPPTLADRWASDRAATTAVIQTAKLDGSTLELDGERTDIGCTPPTVVSSGAVVVAVRAIDWDQTYGQGFLDYLATLNTSGLLPPGRTIEIRQINGAADPGLVGADILVDFETNSPWVNPDLWTFAAQQCIPILGPPQPLYTYAHNRNVLPPLGGGPATTAGALATYLQTQTATTDLAIFTNADGLRWIDSDLTPRFQELGYNIAPVAIAEGYSVSIPELETVATRPIIAGCVHPDQQDQIRSLTSMLLTSRACAGYAPAGVDRSTDNPQYVSILSGHELRTATEDGDPDAAEYAALLDNLSSTTGADKPDWVQRPEYQWGADRAWWLSMMLLPALETDLPIGAGVIAASMALTTTHPAYPGTIQVGPNDRTSIQSLWIFEPGNNQPTPIRALPLTCSYDNLDAFTVAPEPSQALHCE